MLDWHESPLDSWREWLAILGELRAAMVEEDMEELSDIEYRLQGWQEGMDQLAKELERQITGIGENIYDLVEEGADLEDRLQDL